MLILVVVFIFFWYFIIDKGFILSPGSVFFYYNAIVVMQTIINARYIDIYVQCIFLNLFAFLLGSFSLDLFKNRKSVAVKYKEWIKKDVHLNRWTIKHTSLLFLALVLAFFGVYNSEGIVPLKALVTLISSGSEDAAAVYIDSRVGISQGKKYLAPGYIAQFKDYIFPTLSAIYFFHRLYNKKVSFLARSLMLIAMLGLVSSGTRSGLFIFIVAVLYIRIKPVETRFMIGRKGALAAILLLVVFFGALTMLMGRAGDSSSLSEGILNGFTQVIERVAEVTAKENLILFQDHDIMKGSIIAHEWLVGVSTILPGRQVPYSVHFAHLVGYSRGNVPLNALSGLYFNFRYVGILISFLYGLSLRFFFLKLLYKKKSIEITVFITFLAFYIGLAVNPLGIILYGTVTLMLLWLVLRFRYVRILTA